MRIFLTGANGFIGSALARKLVDQGHRVRCLIHRSRERLADLDVEVFSGDVSDPDSLKGPLQGIEAVFHLAARPTDWGPRGLFFRLNAEGTRNVLEGAIAAGVARLVLLSSLAVHRFTGHVDANEDTPADQDKYAYGASKVAAERLTREAQAQRRIQTTIIRPGVVVHGPHDTTAFVHMAPMLASGRWTHVRRGRTLLCYSYVDNLVDGILLAGLRPEGAGQTFILTDDLKLSWADYASAVIRAFGAHPKTLSFPAPLARAAGWTAEMLFRLVRARNPPPITDYRTALVSKDFHFSCEKAKRVLGYKPAISLEEGLERTVTWYRKWKGAQG